MISCDTSLPRRLYEARRVSTASSSGTLVLSVGQSDCKEVSATDAVESQFFRHCLLLFILKILAKIMNKVLYIKDLLIYLLILDFIVLLYSS